MSENERGAGRQREWKLKKGLDAFGNIFGLNICFVVACLPVITIGASLAATYAMAIRLQENEEETVLHGFIYEFKRSFKQATIAFIGVAVAVAVLLAEWILINTTTGAISIFYTIVFYLELLFFALIMAFLFPMIARYNTTLKQAVKNSILLSVGYFFSCVKILVAWVAPIALSIIYPIIFLHTWYLWLLIIFGAIIYGTSYTVRHVFKQNEEALHHSEEEKQEEERKKEEEERQLEEGRAALEEGRMRLEAREDDDDTESGEDDVTDDDTESRGDDVTNDDTESQEGGHGMTEAELEHESAKDPEDMSIQQEQKEEKVSQKPSQSEELAKNLQQTKNAPDQGKQQEQKLNQGTGKTQGAKKGVQGKKVQQEQKTKQEKQEGQKRSEKYQEHVRIQKKQAEKRAEKARQNAEKSKQNAEKSREITEKSKQNSEKPKVQSTDKTKVQDIIQKQKTQQNTQNSSKKKGPSMGR